MKNKKVFYGTFNGRLKKIGKYYFKFSKPRKDAETIQINQVIMI